MSRENSETQLSILCAIFMMSRVKRKRWFSSTANRRGFNAFILISRIKNCLFQIPLTAFIEMREEAETQADGGESKTKTICCCGKIWNIFHVDDDIVKSILSI